MNNENYTDMKSMMSDDTFENTVYCLFEVCEDNHEYLHSIWHSAEVADMVMRNLNDKPSDGASGIIMREWIMNPEWQLEAALGTVAG